MNIRIGAAVITSDGQRIGRIVRLVYHSDEGRVEEVVVHKNMALAHDHIVPQDAIEWVDPHHNVHLRITAEQARALPEFFEYEYVAPTPNDARTLPYPAESGISGGTAGVMPILWRNS